MSKKVYGFRVEEDIINRFNNACNDLPVSFKPNELLKSYMQYIISTSEQYKKTGKVKMGFLNYDRNIIILNLEGVQTSLTFDKDLEQNE